MPPTLSAFDRGALLSPLFLLAQGGVSAFFSSPTIKLYSFWKTPWAAQGLPACLPMGWEFRKPPSHRKL